MTQKFVKLIVILGIVVLSGCSQTTVRMHQDHAEVAKNIQSVVIIPAHVEVEQWNFDGDNEILADKSQQIREEIRAIATKRLKAEKLEVVDFDFATRISQDDEFAYSITKVKESWEVAKEELYEKGLISEKEKANFQSSLGDILNVIANETGADAALLLHYSGFEKSEGMIAKDVASSVLVGVLTLGAVVPIQATQGSFIDVALVDTVAGKIIWSNRKHSTIADSSNAEIAFKELPDLTWKSELANSASAETVTTSPSSE